MPRRPVPWPATRPAELPPADMRSASPSVVSPSLWGGASIAMLEHLSALEDSTYKLFTGGARQTARRASAGRGHRRRLQQHLVEGCVEHIQRLVDLLIGRHQ